MEVNGSFAFGAGSGPTVYIFHLDSKDGSPINKGLNSSNNHADFKREL